MGPFCTLKQGDYIRTALKIILLAAVAMARNQCETDYCMLPSLDVTDVCSLARGKGVLLK